MSDKMWKETGRLYSTNKGIGRTPNKVRKPCIPPANTPAGEINPPAVGIVQPTLNTGVPGIVQQPAPAPARKGIPAINIPAPYADPNCRTIRTYPGIGDILWVLMKLSTLNEKFNWVIASDAPQRGHQVFELLPQTVASVRYATDFHSGVALASNIQLRINSWDQIKKGNKEFYLTINQHFESNPAKNLKEWLPDVGINYYLPYITTAYEAQASEMLNDPHKKYVICYGASYFAARAWGFWGAEKWFEFIMKLYKNDKRFVPVVVGANWDTDMTFRLMALLDAVNIPYVKVVGEKLGLVVEIMKRVTYGFYFPSGLGVIAGTLGVPATMWYPPHLQTMPGTWCDPFLTYTDLFHETKFCTPDEMIEYVNKRGGF